MPEVKPKVILISHTNDPENTVAMAAKLCYSKSNLTDLQEKIEQKDQAKFIKHLAEVGHESVLEHAVFTVGIEGISRACSHQLVRHRLASYSQQSQRYCSFEDEHFEYIVPPNIFKAIKNFQAESSRRVEKSTIPLDPFSHPQFKKAMKAAKDAYKELCDLMRSAGIPESNIPEDARFALPNAAATRIIVTMNARSWRHFFNLRCCGRAQWEIRHIAQEIYKLLRDVAPNIFAGCGPKCAVTGECPEGKRSCGKMKEMKEVYNA